MASRPFLDLTGYGHFNGEESAAKWLARMHRQFKIAWHSESSLLASQVLQALETQRDVDAATFIDSDPQVRSALYRAFREVALSL